MDSETIIALNRQQTVSERDTFTVTRYTTFLSHLRQGTFDVLDVGCNTGRGGAAMKARMPGLRLVGLDCVAERLMKLDPTVYQGSIVRLSAMMFLCPAAVLMPSSRASSSSTCHPLMSSLRYASSSGYFA